VGFSGGLVVDYPHSTRAKKFFLVLMVGPSSYMPQAKGLDGAGEEPQLIHISHVIMGLYSRTVLGPMDVS
jgi:hypothetical protein